MTDQQKKEDVSLQELILNYTDRRYTLVNYTLDWAKEIKRRENGAETTEQSINSALYEILTKKINFKEIEKHQRHDKEEKKDEKGSVKNVKEVKKN